MPGISRSGATLPRSFTTYFFLGRCVERVACAAIIPLIPTRALLRHSDSRLDNREISPMMRGVRPIVLLLAAWAALPEPAEAQYSYPAGYGGYGWGGWGGGGGPTLTGGRGRGPRPKGARAGPSQHPTPHPPPPHPAHPPAHHTTHYPPPD